MLRADVSVSDAGRRTRRIHDVYPGILVVWVQLIFRGIKPLFQHLFEDKQDEILAPILQDLPLLQRGWADSAIESIANLRPLCVEPVEIEYQEQLLGIAQKLNVSSLDGGCTYDPARDSTDTNSLQSQLEAIRMVDDATTLHVSTTHQPRPTDHHFIACSLDCAVANHDIHHKLRVRRSGENATVSWGSL